jgi:phage/plasmid-like protein (TIGR03299 family)
MVVDGTRDTVHFVPKSGYQIHGFEETLIERVARIVGESTGDLHIDSAGVLADGAEGWVSIATGSLLSTPEGVNYYPHLLASSSHNGTLASTIQAVNTMTVCDNTRAMALGEGRENGTVTRTRHSKMSAARLERGEDEARQAMGLIVAAGEEFAAEIKRQCEMTVTDAQWDDFLAALSPLKEDAKPAAITRVDNFRDAVSLLYRKDARVAQWQGTAFGALQALSTWDLWERQAYGSTDHAARNMRESITGEVAKREQERASALMAVLKA